MSAKKLDREKVFGVESKPKSGFLWCLHCERAYRYGEYREVSRGLQMCPYEGCDGDTVVDAFPWEELRENHPEYPEMPETGIVYPQ